MSANGPYDRFGNTYNVSLILQPDDRFNETAYQEYSKLYLPATYAMTYFLGFALMTGVLVHTALYHGHSLVCGIKNMRVEPDDIHAKLMRNYREVPDWWYAFSFILFFSLAIIAVEVSRQSTQCGVPSLICEGLAHIGPRVYPLIGCSDSNHLCAPWGLHICNDRSRSAYTPHSACVCY
jgi:hypothetical protein